MLVEGKKAGQEDSPYSILLNKECGGMWSHVEACGGMWRHIEYKGSLIDESIATSLADLENLEYQLEPEQ